MTPETTAARPAKLPAGSSARRRRFDALVAAYIHELSARHGAERDASRTRPSGAERA
jgi:hypothetical protein